MASPAGAQTYFELMGSPTRDVVPPDCADWHELHPNFCIVHHQDLYEDAIDQFEHALDEEDAERYPEAAASCRWLIGWCGFFRGRYLTAREAFELAVDHLGPEQASEAMWMAIVCLDKAIEAGGGEALRQDLSDLIGEALTRYPLSPRAPKLKLKRAMQAGASPEVVEELLAISPDSDVYIPARRRAAR